MFKRFIRNEDGQVLIIAVVLFVVGTAFATLVVDAGYLYSEKRQVQSAVDAAALSGVIVAATEEGDITKVREEVDKYLLSNLDKTVDNPEVKIDMSDPITVTVDLITDYPAFVARIFQKDRIDISGHAKAEYIEFNFPDFPYSLFSEDEIIILNGNDQHVVGPVYSAKKSNFSKVTIKDSDPEQNRSEDELIETAADGIVYLPDYSRVIQYATKMTFNQFKTKYLSGNTELSGVVEITDLKGNDKIEGKLIGKGVVYSSGDMKLWHLDSSPQSSILFYSDGNVETQKLDFYGTIYTPNGTVEFNGDPNNFGHGKILAKDKLEFNGAKFSLKSYPGNNDWMSTLSGGARLIE